MRRPTVLLTFVIVASACGGGEATTVPSTTDTVVTSVATQPTTTTLGTTTTQVRDPTTTTKPPIVGGVTTRHEDGCAYEGPTEFDVNSDVTFTFINALEIPNAGFQVVKVDEGTTKGAIYEFGVGAVSYQGENEEEDDDWYEPYLPSQTTPGIEYVLTVTLNKVGLHAIVCFQSPEDDSSDYEEFPNYASTLFTVEG